MTDSKMPELHRSFPEAGDGRPMPPMGDELMTAGLNPDDARFVAVQLAKNGLTLVPVAPVADAELEALAETAVRNWLGEMEGFATRGERFFDAVQAGDDMMPWLIAAASTALRARTAQPVGVRVRKLEWDGFTAGSYRIEVDKCGIAMGQTFTGGTPDFPSDDEAITLSAGGPGQVIGAMKCSACGWSVTEGGA